MRVTPTGFGGGHAVGWGWVDTADSSGELGAAAHTMAESLLGEDPARATGTGTSLDLALLFPLFLQPGVSLGLRHCSGPLAAQSVRSSAGRQGRRVRRTWVLGAPCELRSLGRPTRVRLASGGEDARESQGAGSGRRQARWKGGSAAGGRTTRGGGSGRKEGARQAGGGRAD